MEKNFVLSCPVPISERKNIIMGHGSGGKLTAQLVRDLFLPAFDNEHLRKLDDQAVFEAGSARLAFTTDSFVVTPLFFPGGNIGELAVNGTVNDLAMSGARPLFLSAAFIMEEGLAIEELSRVVDAMARAARAAGVSIVTGDTKVVNKGSADKFVHHDIRRWIDREALSDLGFQCRCRRCGDFERVDWRSWHGGDVGAGGARV